MDKQINQSKPKQISVNTRK